MQTLLAGSAAAPQRAAAARPPVQTPPPWPGMQRAAATGTTARRCGVRTALPRPAFHLAAPPQPHSRRLPTLLAGSAAAPQRAAAATPPFQSTPPWPGTRRPAATGTTARLCGVRTALPRPASILVQARNNQGRGVWLLQVFVHVNGEYVNVVKGCAVIRMQIYQEPVNKTTFALLRNTSTPIGLFRETPSP